jgi:glycerol-3-phosphate dehydrogenase
MKFPMQTREERIQTLQENPKISVLIIGAGINGIGTFRDLALQGVDVLMVDKSDYCSGTSAASSHMVHGGIRYLENGEFRLVREAVQERNRLLENAPHLVKPLPTTFPIFKWFSGLFNAPLKFFGLLDRPAERGAIVIKLGMLLYDYYTRRQKTVPQHVFRNKKEAIDQFPAINPEILFTGTYFDGAMPSPERIAIELIQDAVSANERAIPVNYVSLQSAGGKTVILKDELTGDAFEIEPKILINAAGPWIDLVNRSIGIGTNFVSGTKGSHLVLDHPELRRAIGDNEFFFENQDGRIVLIFPLQDKVMIGTSDIRVDDLEHITITDEEIEYFFAMIGRVFPSIQVDHSQIVFTLSGVRPLQRTEGGATGQISRDHIVQVTEPGGPLAFPVLSLVGGKWTSFRAFSEQAADRVLERLAMSRRISTANLPIGGSKAYPASSAEKEAYLKELLKMHQLDLPRLEKLFETYGTRVGELLESQGNAAASMLEHIPDISLGEIKFILANEDVNHLDDLILRRTMLGKLGRVTPDGLQEISQICKGELGWSDQATEDEIERFTEILRAKHKMDFNTFING